MSFIQLVRCYVLLKMFASKSRTKSYILKRHFLIIFKYYAWVSCALNVLSQEQMAKVFWKKIVLYLYFLYLQTIPCLALVPLKMVSGSLHL